MYGANPNIGDNIVPLSVADMEFRTAPGIVENLKKYLDESILGYTSPTDDYYNSVIRWMERRHGFSPKGNGLSRCLLYPCTEAFGSGADRAR